MKPKERLPTRSLSARTLDRLIRQVTQQRSNADELIARIRKGSPENVLERALVLTDSKRAWDREIGARLLGSLPGNLSPRRRSQVLRALAHADASTRVRKHSIKSLGLGYIAGPKERRFLARIIRTRASELRFTALASYPVNYCHEILSDLLKLSKDEDPAIKEWAVFYLGLYLTRRSDRRVERAIRARLRDKDRVIRLEALKALFLSDCIDHVPLPLLIREIRAEGLQDKHFSELMRDVLDALHRKGVSEPLEDCVCEFLAALRRVAEPS